MKKKDIKLVFKGADKQSFQELLDDLRQKGEWIPYNLWDYECSNCKKVYGREHNFCPNCGADMRKGDTE